MRNVSVLLVAVVVWLVAAATAGTHAAAREPQAAPVAQAATGVPIPAGSAPSAYQPVVKQYCTTCHNERVKTADLLLDKANFTDVTADTELWEKVIRKLRLGAMPPQGMPRPDDATLKAFVASLENTLDAAYQAHVDPGRS